MEVFDEAAKKKDELIAERARAKYIFTKDRAYSNGNIPMVKEGMAALNRLDQNNYKKTEYVANKGKMTYELSKAQYDYFKTLKEQEKANIPTTPKKSTGEPVVAKEAVKITTTKSGDSTITVPKASKVTTLAEQKKYLLAEIDVALKDAPEGMSVPGDLEDNKKTFGTVTIEVPGDGTFTLINNKTALQEFKDKRVSKLDTSVPKPGTKLDRVIPPRRKFTGTTLDEKAEEIFADNKRTLKNIGKDIKTILTSTRGSIGDVELTQERKEALERLMQDAKDVGQSFSDFLKSEGFSSSEVDKILELQSKMTLAMEPPEEPVEEADVKKMIDEAIKIVKQEEGNYQKIPENTVNYFGLTAEEFEDKEGVTIPVVKQMNLLAEHQKALDFITQDFDNATEIAMGNKELPLDIQPLAFVKLFGMELARRNDVKTLREYLSNPKSMIRMGTEIAQQLKAAHFNIDEFDTFKTLQEIQKRFTEQFEKQTKKSNKNKVIEEQTKANKELQQKLDDINKEFETYREKYNKDSLENLEQETISKEKKKLPLKKKATVFTDEAAAAAHARWQSRHATTTNALINPQDILDAVIIGGNFLEHGAINFVDWSKKMLDFMGKDITPHLEDVWKKASDEYKVAIKGKITDKINIVLENVDGVSKLTKKQKKQLTNSAQELAKTFILEGVHGRDNILNAVHDVMVQENPWLDKRTTMDIISGYSQYTELSKEAADAELRAYKGEMQQIAKIWDILEKGTASKTGQERRTLDDKERGLQKIVENYKKKYGKETVDKDKQLKTALDAIKTRLRHDISDLEAQIVSRQKLIKERHSVAYDAETTALKKHRDMLKEQFDSVFGKPVMTDAQRLQMAINVKERMIKEYTRRIKEGDLSLFKKARTLLPSAKLTNLNTELDALRKEYKVLKDLANPKKTAAEIALQAYKTRTENRIKQLEAKIQSRDFEAKVKVERTLDAEGNKLLERKLAAQMAFDASKRIGDQITDEQIQTIMEQTNQLRVLKEKYNPATRTWETKEDGIAFGLALFDFHKYIDNISNIEFSKITTQINAKRNEIATTWKEGYRARSAWDVFVSGYQLASDLWVASKASYDNSFHGRQGIGVLYRYPKIWAQNFIKSFDTIAKELKGIDAQSAIMANVYSNPYFMDGSFKDANLIPKHEEMYRTSLLGRIPVLGRGFKASESSYATSAILARTKIYTQRADAANAPFLASHKYLSTLLQKMALYKFMSEWFGRTGTDMTDKQNRKALGAIINSFTGRGGADWTNSGIARFIFWAPKMIQGNLDLVRQAFGFGINGKTPSKYAVSIAQEHLVAKTVAITTILSVLSGLNAALGGDDDAVERDPRSTNFGKLKIGNTRFDITGGLASYITLISRILTMKVKNKYGIMEDYSWYNPEHNSFIGTTGIGLVTQFIIQKTNPLTQVFVERFLTGKTFAGDKPTWEGSLPIPIIGANIYKLKDEFTPSSVGGVVADFFGISANTYDVMNQKWETKSSKEMREFKSTVPKEMFELANKKANMLFQEWYKTRNADFDFLEAGTAEKKMKYITKKREEFKKEAFDTFGFKPSRED
jgi:hypothetical protein